MRVHLMSPTLDFDPDLTLPDQAEDLIADLQLEPVLTTMAAGDKFLYDIARTAILTGAPSVDDVIFRHEVLRDTERHPDLMRELYDMTTAALEDRRRIHRSSFFASAETRLHMAIEVLGACLPYLRRLHDLATELDATCQSHALSTFYAILRRELEPTYLAHLERELDRLRFRHGVVLSAHLGQGNTGVGFVLRAPDDTKRTFFHRIPLDRPTRSFTIAPRDDASFQALGALRDTAVHAASAAAVESVDHVIDFLAVLRQESAFYLGCRHLAAALSELGHDTCLPDVEEPGSARHNADGLYDAGLALENHTHAVPSDLDTRLAPLTLITGANRGGKSTFLRAIGIATLLARAGAYVPATGYRVPLYRSVHTHFRREEDETLASGKFDDELSRIATTADRLEPGSLLLSNESFSSTNEREGSQIAEDILDGLADAGVDVIMVTHLYELAHRLGGAPTPVTYLRAERTPDGRRTYRIVPGDPEPSVHARDLYDGVFAALDAARGDPGRPDCDPTDQHNDEPRDEEEPT